MARMNSIIDDLRHKAGGAIETAYNIGHREGYANGEAAALAKIKNLFGGTVVGAAAKAVKKAAAAPAAKTPAVRQKRRNPWANLTPEERQIRVNAIRKGKGLPLVPLAPAAEPKKRGPTVRDNSPPVIPIDRATEPDLSSVDGGPLPPASTTGYGTD